MDKILTIVVPTYNMEALLPRCLESLLMKEYRDFLEVLIVNDGSKDNSLDIARSYAKRYSSLFVVIDKLNGNYGSCINSALKVATGKYIKVLDSDDYFDTIELTKFVNRLLRTDADVVLTNHTYRWNNYKKEYVSLNYHDGQIVNIDKEIVKCFFMHNVTYRVDLLKDISYKQTEGISYTDQEWIFYPMCKAVKLSYFNLNLYQYVLGRDGQTMDEKVFIRNIHVVELLVIDMLLFLKDNKPSLSLARRKYLENVVKIQMNKIYLIELVLKKKSDLCKSEIEKIEELSFDYDESFYLEFNNLTYSKIRYVKMYRKGKLFSNFIRTLLINIHKLKGKK